jgi:hypothetical protein
MNAFSVAFGGKADMPFAVQMSAYDPKRILKFNFENKNGPALKPRQVVMQKHVDLIARSRLDGRRRMVKTE